MIYIKRNLVEQMLEHVKRESPNEACGILAGEEEEVKKVYEMTNIEGSSKTFFMDPNEQLRVMKEIRNLGLEMVGIYHSHLETDAYPSAHDVELAYYPEVSYVIVSIKDRANPSIRSFRIIEGKSKEEEVVIK